MDTNYFPVDGRTVSINAMKSFDLYCVLDGRMAVYMAANADISENIRNRMDEIDVKTLYVHRKDLTCFHSYLEEVLGTILDHPQIDEDIKASSVFTVLGTLGKQVFAIPEQKILKLYKQAAIEVTNYIMADERAFPVLSRKMDFTFSLANHNINVGITSMSLARQILGNDPKYNYAEIGPGFFLHDIGKTTIPLETLNKKGPLSPVEWRLIKRHPYEGMRILNKFQMLSNEVKIIVSQHHERHNGSGYPKGLTGDKIHVFGKICSIADCFDSLTSQRPFREKCTTFNALKIMKQEMFKDFDPVFFQKFILMLSR